MAAVAGNQVRLINIKKEIIQNKMRNPLLDAMKSNHKLFNRKMRMCIAIVDEHLLIKRGNDPSLTKDCVNVAAHISCHWCISIKRRIFPNEFDLMNCKNS